MKKHIKKLFGALACMSFLALYATFGGVEQGTTGLLHGAVQSGACLLACAAFTYLAGGFTYYIKRGGLNAKQR